MIVNCDCDLSYEALQLIYIVQIIVASCLASRILEVVRISVVFDEVGIRVHWVGILVHWVGIRID